MDFGFTPSRIQPAILRFRHEVQSEDLHRTGPLFEDVAKLCFPDEHRRQCSAREPPLLQVALAVRTAPLTVLLVTRGMFAHGIQSRIRAGYLGCILYFSFWAPGLGPRPGKSLAWGRPPPRPVIFLAWDPPGPQINIFV